MACQARGSHHVSRGEQLPNPCSSHGSLRNGCWASASDGSFYFAESSDGRNVPKGIAFDMVDEEAANDRSRRRLYEGLGATCLDLTQVFKIILDQHSCHGQSYLDWTVDDVVAHAQFLHNAPSRPRYYDLSVLKVTARDSDNLHSRKHMYIDDASQQCRISELYGPGNTAIRLIHDLYLDDASSPWLRWLQGELRVATLQKLTDTFRGLSTEFRWLMEMQPSSVWLLLLCDYWDHYSNMLHLYAIRTAIEDAVVLCTDGRSRGLSHVYLATSDVASESLAVNTHSLP